MTYGAIADDDGSKGFYAHLLNDILDAAAGTHAVISGWATTQRGAGANMSVDVALGKGFANDTYISTGSTTNVAISASDPANPRYDVVTIDSSGTIAVVTGTAAVTPAIPDHASTKTRLAVVLVGAGVTSITTANCLDARLLEVFA